MYVFVFSLYFIESLERLKVLFHYSIVLIINIFVFEQKQPPCTI